MTQITADKNYSANVEMASDGESEFECDSHRAHWVDAGWALANLIAATPVLFVLISLT